MTDSAQTTQESTAHLTAKPSFLERKLPKGRPDVIPSVPFHSVTRAAFTDAVHTTLKLPLTVSVAELSNKGKMSEMVRRLVLFRNPAAIEGNGVGAKRAREESDDSDDEGSIKAKAQPVGPSKAVVCIKSIGVPQNHVQVKGQGGVSSVRFILPVDVIVATIHHGICPGIVREEAPFPGACNVEVQCDSERIIVTCICPEEEPAVKGLTVLVAAEPSCLRLQVFRPPRVSRGKFQKTIDVKLGQTELTFIPDFDGDAKIREAAEAKNAAAAAAAAAAENTETTQE